MGGQIPSEGRVELCVDEVFGTVCDDSFDSADATIVCRQLGYHGDRELIDDVIVHGWVKVGDGCGDGVKDIIYVCAHCVCPQPPLCSLERSLGRVLDS